jgi:serine/threonine protein kinase
MAICPTCLTKYPDDAATCAVDGAALVPDEAYAHVDRDLEPGDQVGEYRIVGKIGTGGFGVVYRAEHPVIGKSAAVKVLGRQFSSNPQMVSRFIAEARAVNQIRHRNIIDVFAFGQLPDGRQYYVMELLEGQTFDKYLKAQGRLPLDQALPVLRGIARAMDAAHGKGILHRDLKPDNVFLIFDEDGQAEPKLLDFGLVKLLGDPSGTTHKTKTGTPMGTPFYMSPEQCRGLEVDARTDVYSFGVMVFEVICGHVPFDGASAMDVLLKHMTVVPPSASAEVPDLPARVDVVLGRMMAKDPEQRPPSLGAALAELAEAAGLSLQSVPRLPRPAPSPERPSLATSETIALPSSGRQGQTFLSTEADVGPPARSSRKLVFAGLVLVCAAAGAAGVFALGRKDEPHAGIAEPRPTPSPLPSASGAPPASAASSASAVAADETREIDVTIEGAPRGATVSLDGKVLGHPPGPFKVKAGAAVTLTVSAKGYRSREVALTPTENVLVPVTLERAPVPTGPRLDPDLEGFDKK